MTTFAEVPNTMLEVRLKRRPVGVPTADDFEVVRVPVPVPERGEVLVRVLWLSVDPYLRELLDEHTTYRTPFGLGCPLKSRGIGSVVGFRGEGGDALPMVQGSFRWQEFTCCRENELTPLPAGPVPPRAYLGILGATGLTAHVGLTRIAQVRAGETVYVSAAAGAVGGTACQIARVLRCRVVGSAGSESKVRWLLDRAGVDAAFNYKEGSLSDHLAAVCPEGIDVYFDNVGASHLGAVLPHMKPFGRVVLCGSIDDYHRTGPARLGSLLEAVNRRLTLQGFLVGDHHDLLSEFRARMTAWIDSGQVCWEESIAEGLENAPRAFLGLFRGCNLGKVLVRVGVPSAPSTENKQFR